MIKQKLFKEIIFFRGAENKECYSKYRELTAFELLYTTAS